VAHTPDADVYLTADSDSIYDPYALEELLKPLVRRRVKSVAGVVLAANAGRSLLCRITDLWFVAGQLVDRSALSALRSVWVNSGPIAVYRAEILRDNLHGYLNETFFGRPVRLSDDSLLTLYALLAGETVQQPTAYVFSLMPQTWSHHRRQYLRWMRGSFIRSWWRIRYLPVLSPAWWLHVSRWAQVVASAAVLVSLVALVGAGHGDMTAVGWLLGVSMTLGYAQTLRYLAVRRADVGRGWSVSSWLLTPLAVGWALVVLRVLRWYAVATWWSVGWGTRRSVEVSLTPAAQSQA
jgi:hyaluronan synthase